MNSVVSFEIVWKRAPKGDNIPCHLCEFKGCGLGQHPCCDCISNGKFRCRYPVIVKSDILPF